MVGGVGVVVWGVGCGGVGCRVEWGVVVWGVGWSGVWDGRMCGGMYV